MRISKILKRNSKAYEKTKKDLALLEQGLDSGDHGPGSNEFKRVQKYIAQHKKSKNPKHQGISSRFNRYLESYMRKGHRKLSHKK